VTIKSKLRIKRLMKDYTQDDMANKMGIHIGTYSKKENGLIAWSVEDVKKMRDILDLSGEDIIDIFFTD